MRDKSIKGMSLLAEPEGIGLVQLAYELSDVLRNAPDIFPPALARANRVTRSSCKHKVLAIEGWLAAQPPAGALSDRAALLRTVAERHPNETAPAVVLARECHRAGQITAAVEAIDAARSRGRQDLYHQDVARILLSATNPMVASPAATRDHLKDRFCMEPFRTLEPTPDRSTSACCPGWSPVRMGNINEDEADALWGSDAAQGLWEPIADRSFRYYSRTGCALITGRMLPTAGTPEAKAAIASHIDKPPAAPIPKLRHPSLSQETGPTTCPARPAAWFPFW